MPAMPTEAAEFALQIISGPLAGKLLHEKGTTFRVGRTNKSSLQIKDPSVSEKHAEVVLKNGEWFIRDLGSSNGTLLNGSEVADELMVLRSGDELRFGTETTAKVQIPLPEGESDSLTVEEYLEAECTRLEQRIKGRAEHLANNLRLGWLEEKARLVRSPHT